MRASASASLRLDVGRQNHPAPLLYLVGDQLGEIGGRARQHGRAEIGEPRLEVGIGKARVDLSKKCRSLSKKWKKGK
jgi:hypothetical protein